MSTTAASAPDPWLADDDVAPLAVLLDPRGRIARRGFWLWGVLVLSALTLLLHALLGIARVPGPTAEHLVNLLLLWPALSISIKRLHDRDRSGWWVLALAVPVVGWLLLLVVNGFLAGTPGPNRFGPPPGR